MAGYIYIAHDADDIKSCEPWYRLDYQLGDTLPDLRGSIIMFLMRIDQQIEQVYQAIYAQFTKHCMDSDDKYFKGYVRRMCQSAHKIIEEQRDVYIAQNYGQPVAEPVHAAQPAAQPVHAAQPAAQPVPVYAAHAMLATQHAWQMQQLKEHDLEAYVRYRLGDEKTIKFNFDGSTSINQFIFDLFEQDFKYAQYDYEPKTLLVHARYNPKIKALLRHIFIVQQSSKPIAACVIQSMCTVQFIIKLIQLDRYVRCASGFIGQKMQKHNRKVGAPHKYSNRPDQYIQEQLDILFKPVD